MIRSNLNYSGLQCDRRAGLQTQQPASKTAHHALADTDLRQGPSDEHVG